MSHHGLSRLLHLLDPLSWPVVGLEGRGRFQEDRQCRCLGFFLVACRGAGPSFAVRLIVWRLRGAQCVGLEGLPLRESACDEGPV